MENPVRLKKAIKNVVASRYLLAKEMKEVVRPTTARPAKKVQKSLSSIFELPAKSFMEPTHAYKLKMKYAPELLQPEPLPSPKRSPLRSGRQQQNKVKNMHDKAFEYELKKKVLAEQVRK